MNVVFSPSHGVKKNVELSTNTHRVSPYPRLKFSRHEFAAIFGAEYNVNHV
ncbi:MAG TPA: hypothetical protein VNH19_17000 [Candidatus Limnocylindrales bacterium]|nr:hypothetical protein [Candidatus Limnocylindrales bacterium]